MEPQPPSWDASSIENVANYLLSDENFDSVLPPNEDSIPSEWSGLIHHSSKSPVVDGMEGECNDTTGTILPSSTYVTEGEQNRTTFVGLVKEAEIDSKEKGKKVDKKIFNITLEQLQQQFGKPLDDAAKALGVSKSTLKRAKDRLGIERWPSHPQNKVNPSIFKGSRLGDIFETCKDDTVYAEVHLGNDMKRIVMYTRDIDVREFLDKVQLSFGINAENYKLKYWTEDNRFLSIRDDNDLKDCIKRFEEAKTTVKIYLIPKSIKSTPSSGVGSSKRPRVVDHHRTSSVDINKIMAN